MKLRLLLCIVALAPVVARAAAEEPVSLNGDLQALCEPLAIPGAVALVLKGDTVVASGVYGVRKAGNAQPVTLDDKFHIGSCTKAMTATLAARFVERGLISWDTRLVDALPELAGAMRPAWKDVTLVQLLAHQGGAPGGLDAEGIWGRAWLNSWRAGDEQRARLARDLLGKTDPVPVPPDGMVYSNAGYALAGHMLERTAGRAWEKLLMEEVFVPFGMKSAGFGAPAARFSYRPNQPLGHRPGKDSKPEPVSPGVGSDNPAAIGPGGSVHCSAHDLARFLRRHLVGARDGDSYLKLETWRKLHTPWRPGPGYALGWGVPAFNEQGGSVLSHDGSNTMFYTTMRIDVDRDLVVVVHANYAPDGLGVALGKLTGAWVERFGR